MTDKTIMHLKERTLLLNTKLQQSVALLLGVQVVEIDTTLTFFDLGLDSLACIRLSRQIRDFIGSEVDPEWLFDYPTIDQLAIFLSTNSVENSLILDALN